MSFKWLTTKRVLSIRDGGVEMGSGISFSLSAAIVLLNGKAILCSYIEHIQISFYMRQCVCDWG